MTNKEISKLLRNVAASLAIKDEKKYRFQIIAYQKAADAIENSTAEVKDLYKNDKLEQIPGIGESISQSLTELLKTGEVKHFRSIMEGIPAAVFPLLDIPSFGPKKAYKLTAHFHLKNAKTIISDLEKLAKRGKIADLEGFGEKSQQDILRAIGEYKMGLSKDVRMALPFAAELADKLISYLKSEKTVRGAFPLGSLRRMKSTIGDIDIAVATENPSAVIKHFVAYPYKERILEQGPATASILLTGNRHIDLMTQPPESFGSLLQHFTGSKEHNIHLREYALKRGLSLSEKGIKQMTNTKELIKKYDTEEKFYHFLGLDWIPPEIREDTGEIEHAESHTLPDLVTLKDIKGDFHIHSSFLIEPSHDLGQNSAAEMLKKAATLGYEYLGFSEHNPSFSKHTTKQMYDLIARRNEYINKAVSSHKSVRAFKLLEVDILTNGSLAIDDKSLSILDGALVSIHSSFSMDKKRMTERVLRGLSHPKAKILSHPSGRLINQRVGYDLDWEKLFDFAKKNHKALEINASPMRLDLRDTLVKEAVRMGIMMTINTDSHALDQMDIMKYGVAVARRGWATKNDILNTMKYNTVNEWFYK